jgi:TRAP transporter TAXI family solute receptor
VTAGSLGNGPGESCDDTNRGEIFRHAKAPRTAVVGPGRGTDSVRAGLPVPAFVEASQLMQVRRFGLTESERTTFLQKFPHFSPFRVPASTYAGQTTAVESVAVWNFAAMHRDGPEDLAYWLTRLTLSKRAQLNEMYSAASSTSTSHLAANTFLPFHPGALRYYRELGLEVLSPASESSP